MIKSLFRVRLALLAAAVAVAVLAAPIAASAAGVVDMDAGEWYSTAVLSDGTLWGWGYNSQGQLGDGTLLKHLSPVRVGTDSDWVDVSAGYRHTLGVKADGSLWAWGWNKDGELGIGHAENTYVPDHWHTTPARVATGTVWLEVATGFAHSVALDATGTIWAWGGNYDGQLGDGTFSPAAAPRSISTSPGPGLQWKRVAADGDHTYALASDGYLWRWGQGSPVPAKIAFAGPFAAYLPSSQASWWALSPSEPCVAVTMADSALWSWATTTSASVTPTFYDYEFIDAATATFQTSATQRDSVSVLVSLDHSLGYALDDSNQLAPLSGGEKPVVARLIVDNALDWTHVTSGADHFLISKSDGSLWGWGENTYGQIGNGLDTDRTSKLTVPARVMLPTPIPDVYGMTQADAGDEIVDSGFVVGTVTQVATTAADIGVVLSQSPAADTLVMPSGKVNIVVSAGPPVLVPHVLGMLQADAETEISTAGLLVGSVTEAYSSSVATGAVISQTPMSGTPVIVNSRVNLVISKGKQPRYVPSVAGKTEASAKSTLQGATFIVGSVKKEYSTVYPAGQATRTDPPAGSLMREGDTVVLYVSLGKPKPWVSTPIAPATMYTTRTYTVYGYLKPQHTATTSPVRIYRYRWYGGKWVNYGFTSAKVSNYSTYSKYAASIKLTAKGTWRLRAMHPEDSAHALAWSSTYDTVTVR